MKKVLLFASLCFCVNVAFAQKKAVKDAKSNISKTNEARKLIKPALTDAETANDPETWFVAGNVEYKAFENQLEAEMTKELTGKSGDLVVMYDGIYNMIPYFLVADSLGQLPDIKGKVKNKFRKDIAKNLQTAYPHYINGGVYYNDEAKKNLDEGNDAKAAQLYNKASDFFKYYWDIPTYKVLDNANFQEGESAPLIKYYAVVCAIQGGDKKKSIDLIKRLMAEPYVENDAYKESDLYELLADEYSKNNDSLQYVETLKFGAEKFPDSKFFVPNLINEYLKAEKYEEAIAYLDQAVKNDPSNACDFVSVKASLLADKQDFEGAKENYKSVLKNTPDCERAIYGIGVTYILQAEALQNLASQETNRAKVKEMDKETAALYEDALPYLEQYRAKQEAKVKENGKYKDDADLKEMKQVLIALNSAYYNLNFLENDKYAQKFTETDNELKELKTYGY